MMKTIGIIAPVLDEKQPEMDFVLRLKNSGYDLTLKHLYELANNSYNISKISSGLTYENTSITAAGYYLTGLLRSKGYDTYLVHRLDDEKIQSLSSLDPEIVCVSTTMIWERNSLKHIIERIRYSLPDSFIIVGGVLLWKSYCWFQSNPNARSKIGNPEQTDSSWCVFPCNRKDINADVFVISPHGGMILLDVINEFQRGKNRDFDQIPNLALPDNEGRFFFTKRIDEKIDYNQDFTRWDLLDELPFRIPIRTSIGCPYRCAYCDFCQLYPKIFLRSMESLQAELKLINDSIDPLRRPFMLHLTDDNVFMNRRRIDELCNVLIESGTDLFWASFMRAQAVNLSNIELIKRSRLMLAIVGVESGDQGQLNRMNKKQVTTDVKKGVELLDETGIMVLMTFLVGYPGETEETLNRTSEFVKGLSIGHASSNYRLYPLHVAPLSELAGPEARARWKIEGTHDSWHHETMDSDQALRSCFELFKKIDNIPYHHPEESSFFNQRFSLLKRRKLFQLRHELTLKLINRCPWDDIAQTFKQISLEMDLGSSVPGEELRSELIVPDVEIYH